MVKTHYRILILLNFNFNIQMTRIFRLVKRCLIQTIKNILTQLKFFAAVLMYGLLCVLCLLSWH